MATLWLSAKTSNVQNTILLNRRILQNNKSNKENKCLQSGNGPNADDRKYCYCRVEGRWMHHDVKSKATSLWHCLQLNLRIIRLALRLLGGVWTWTWTWTRRVSPYQNCNRAVPFPWTIPPASLKKEGFLFLPCFSLSLSLSLSLLFVLLAPRTFSLSFFATPDSEPRSDKDLGESLRETLLGDVLGK
jgi:hypothetical protein